MVSLANEQHTHTKKAVHKMFKKLGREAYEKPINIINNKLNEGGNIVVQLSSSLSPTSSTWLEGSEQEKGRQQLPLENSRV